MTTRPRSGARSAALGFILALATAAAAAPPVPRLTVVHRLVDERAARAGQSEAPTATVGDVTRYALVAPLLAPVSLAAVPVVGKDGTLVLSFPCPEPLAGREGVISVFLPSKQLTRAVRVRCPAADGPPVQVSVPALTPGEKLLALVNARGLPERIESEVVTLPAGARLRLALGLAGNRPGEKPAPVRFRVTAKAAGRPAPVLLLERTLDVTASADDRGWVEVDLPLDPARAALGAAVHLVFETELGDAAAGFPVWGDPIVLAPAPARAAVPWNVLLVSLDTLRADRLGCYGNPRATSPALDQLAREGTLFPVATAPASWTLPSHVSLMTGLYACAHGVTTSGLGHSLTPGARPLATLLRARSYLTAAFTEDGFLEPGVFQPGFSSYRADGVSESKTKVATTVGAARAWLRANASAPFLLFVHTYQTHAPYLVPVSYRQTFTTYDTPDGPHPLGGAPGNLQELATYDTAIRYTDDVLATLFATLKELGLDRHTIVVVTSDHGEAFWEHGLSGHGKTLYDEEIRVPLIWWAPGLIAAERRVPGIVGLVDVLPTLLDLLGMGKSELVQGQSLAPLLRADRTDAQSTPDRVVFSETSVDGYQLAARAATWMARLEGEGAPQFFDLDDDPGEQKPQTGGPFADAARDARLRFDTECARMKERLGAAAPTTPRPPPPAPDPQHQQNLRALGYVD